MCIHAYLYFVERKKVLSQQSHELVRSNLHFEDDECSVIQVEERGSIPDKVGYSFEQEMRCNLLLSLLMLHNVMSELRNSDMNHSTKNI